MRKRLTWKHAGTTAGDNIEASWGESFGGGQVVVAATGLYGYTKSVEGNCTAATRKLAKVALRVAKNAYDKDPDVVSFLATHLKRGRSTSARVLLAAMKEIGPKVGRVAAMEQTAAGGDYGLYGFKARTADLGLDACREVRGTAGRIASDLHRRRADMHEKITGFLREHQKQGKCAYSGMLASCYPDSDVKIASVPTPESVAGWLSWEG